MSNNSHHIYHTQVLSITPEEEPSGPLSVTAAEAGGHSTDGSTRTKVVHQKEMLRYKLMVKALSNFPNRQARPVTAFQNVADDKCAGRWLLAIPSSDLALTSPVFKEAISSHLLLPSPAIREGGWHGREVPGGRGEAIDLYGDAIMSNHHIVGDSWRKRHDTVKQHVMAEAALAGIAADCEVYGLFSNLLPAALTGEGGELQTARARQGKVPDFRLLLPTPDGPKNCLAELKVISAGKTWYPRGTLGKGADRRADRLPAEYERTLRDLDARFLGAPAGPDPGPLVTRFRALGGLEEGKLVAGPWGDLSSDLHNLLRCFAQARCAAMARARGWEGDADGLLGKVMGDTRRATSVTVVRAQAMCLLERLAHLGPGARAAAQRRQTTLRLEERRRRDRQAFELAHHRRERVGRAFVE